MLRWIGDVVAVVLFVVCLLLPARTVETIKSHFREGPLAARLKEIVKSQQEVYHISEELHQLRKDAIRRELDGMRYAQLSGSQKKDAPTLAGFPVLFDIKYQDSLEREERMSTQKQFALLDKQFAMIDSSLLTERATYVLYTMLYLPLIVAYFIITIFCKRWALQEQTDYWRQRECAHLSKVKKWQQEVARERRDLDKKRVDLEVEIAQRVKRDVDQKTSHLQSAQAELSQERQTLEEEWQRIAHETKELQQLRQRTAHEQSALARERDNVQEDWHHAEEVLHSIQGLVPRLDAGVQFLVERLQVRTLDELEEHDPSFKEIVRGLAHAMKQTANL